MNNFIKTIKSLGKTKLISLAAIMGTLLLFFGYLITKGATTSLVPVSEEIETFEMGKVIEKLESMNIDYKITDRGILMVHKDEKSKVLITLAGLGVKTNITGYELFDKVDSFSATNFMQTINNIRAIEGEITRSILTFHNIKNARVHINIPKKSIFQEAEFQPRAAVLLDVKKNKTVENEQIKAIQNLVSVSVVNMKPSSVKVMDTNGKLLSKESDEDSSISDIKNCNDIKFNYESRLKYQLEDILERSLGIGKVRVNVSVDMDFNQFSENSEKYDPNEKVVRSEQLSDEKTDESSSENQMTIEKEIKEEDAEKNSEKSKNNSSKKQQTKNYEISKTIKSLIKNPGEIKQISVAVLVDGSYKINEKTKQEEYIARSESDIEKISALVKSAIGFKKERNDKVEVVNMRFHQEKFDLNEERQQFIYGFKKDSVLAIFDKITIGTILLFIIIVVIKPIIQNALKLKSIDPESIDDIMQFTDNFELVKQGAKMTNVTNNHLNGAGGSGVAGGKDVTDDIEEKINIEKIDGMIKKSSVQGISELIDKYPDRSVVVLREWLNEGTGNSKS